ncbi:hypothetical protein ACFVUS_25045 [Nocardia sp. NPDC058058]|uniref:hypothetical protein n=1 Tax=Nocardia sp. NPDC058058 TaxID=3346317 RepID=UPI0036D86DC1
MMKPIAPHIDLSAFQVRWSPQDAAFVAHSARYPGLTYADEWSSLAAVDGLIDTIEQTRTLG